MKPKVYTDTTIPSYLTARSSNDLRAMANQHTTMEWWEYRRPCFDIFISEFVVLELSQGNSEAADRRLAAIEGISELEVTQDAKILAQSLISEGPVPKNAEIDAFHIAVSAVNGMDYLLTWNCKHIANAAIRPMIELLCRRKGY